jgi:VHL beta domain
MTSTWLASEGAWPIRGLLVIRTFLTRFAGLLALMIGFGVSVPATAQETSYDKVGRWSVMAFMDGANFAFCTADVDNGQVQLRLATDGRMWQIGVPYYGNKKQIEGYYGFGVAGEVGNFNSAGDGWAVMPINGDQVNAFRSNPSFSINLDRGEQTWNLAGAPAAIAKAQECARNKGRKPAPAPVATGAGKDCPAPGSVKSRPGGAAVTVTFFNGGNVPGEIYWIDFDGNWKKYHTLGPNRNVQQRTYGGHPWVVVFPGGRCHAEIFMPKPGQGAENNNFQFW